MSGANAVSVSAKICRGILGRGMIRTINDYDRMFIEEMTDRIEMYHFSSNTGKFRVGSYVWTVVRGVILKIEKELLEESQ